MDRRSVLKLFGITAAVATAGVAVTEAEGPAIPVLHPSERPLQNPMAPGLLKPPEGFTYNWKRVFLTEDEPDLENILRMVKYGWKPVPLARHRDELRPGTADSNKNVFSYWIEHGGLVLMEKPTKDIPPPKAFAV